MYALALSCRRYRRSRPPPRVLLCLRPTSFPPPPPSIGVSTAPWAACSYAWPTSSASRRASSPTPSGASSPSPCSSQRSSRRTCWTLSSPGGCRNLREQYSCVLPCLTTPLPSYTLVHTSRTKNLTLTSQQQHPPTLSRPHSSLFSRPYPHLTPFLPTSYTFHMHSPTQWPDRRRHRRAPPLLRPHLLAPLLLVRPLRVVAHLPSTAG